jgi:hypothetical protein
MTLRRRTAAASLGLTCTVMLALTLVAPPVGASPTGAREGEARSAPAQDNRARATPERPDHDRPADAPGQQRRADGGAAAQDAPPADRNRESAPDQQRADGNGPGARAEGDGNRGSVKIRATGAETHPPSNQPHPGCLFDVHFFGFDAGSADVTFRAHPPTGGGDRPVLLSTSVDLEGARGNGLSAVLTAVDLRPAFEAAGITPHDRQGHHVKLLVDAGGPGGAKQKVFWIDCPVAGDDATTGAGEPTPTAGEAGAAEAEVLGAELERTLFARYASRAEVLRDLPHVDRAAVAGAVDVAPLATGLATAGGDTEVLGVETTRAAGTQPGSLPRTGAGFDPLLVTALLTIVVGAAMVGLERRSRRAPARP